MREYDETSKNKYENKIEKCDQPVPGDQFGTMPNRGKQDSGV